MAHVGIEGKVHGGTARKNSIINKKECCIVCQREGLNTAPNNPFAAILENGMTRLLRVQVFKGKSGIIKWESRQTLAKSFGWHISYEKSYFFFKQKVISEGMLVTSSNVRLSHGSHGSHGTGRSPQLTCSAYR